MKSAEQIRNEQLEAVIAHNAQVAQYTARDAIEALRECTQQTPLRFLISREYTREDVGALLEQLAPYLALLAEVAPSLPEKQAHAAGQEAAE